MDQKWFHGIESKNLKKSDKVRENWNRKSRLCESLVVMRNRFWEQIEPHREDYPKTRNALIYGERYLSDMFH